MVSNASRVLAKLVKLTKDNSPILTTVVGASGVVAVAVLAAKAGARASQRVEQLGNIEHHRDLTAKDVVGATWRFYIPTAVAAGITIGAIVTGHRINASRAAATTAALALSERAFDDYRERVVERLGAEEEHKVRDEVRDIERKRQDHSSVVMFGEGTIPVMDLYSGRFFNSDKQSIRAAVNDVNSIIWQQNYASLSDFYYALDIPTTQHSDSVGWNADHMLDVAYSTAMTPDDKPCLVIQFTFQPKPDFANFSGGSAT